MHYNYQVITTPTADTPGTSILLHFDDKRYIFGNVSEGAQRAFNERGAGIQKVSEVFLTGKTDWASHGGLIGMILTLADVKSAAQEEHKKSMAARKVQKPRVPEDVHESAISLSIHGGPNLTHSLATARKFVFRKNLPLSVEEYDGSTLGATDDPNWYDENIQVWAMAISPTAASSPKSPRKRSHDEAEEAQSRLEAAQLRKAVVSQMFDSDWRLDALVESRLDQVKLPAALFNRNAASNKIEPYVGPKPGEPDCDPSVRVLTRRPWPGALIHNLPRTTPSATSMSYIIRGYPTRGKFQAAKAKALGVKPGPDFGLLAKGETVKSGNGSTVTPDMVLEPDRPGKGVAIVDIPTIDYIDNLLLRPEWQSAALMDTLHAVVWILGPGVAGDARLHAFIKDRPTVQHIASSQDCCPNSLTFASSAASAIRLNRMARDLFPIPVHDIVTLPQIGSGSTNVDRANLTVFKSAVPGLKIVVEPIYQLDMEDIREPLDTGRIVADVPHHILEMARGTTDDLVDPSLVMSSKLAEAQQDLPGKDAQIITLGTGSAQPSKYRNVSATLLRVPGRGSYLLDCGENTLGQLRRLFEPEELQKVLRELKLIWISHLHADHHLGTASVIKAWRDAVFGTDPAEIAQRANEKNLVVASHPHMIKWLQEYSEVEDIGMRHVFPLKSDINSAEGPHRQLLDTRLDAAVLADLREKTGLEGIAVCYVNHCYGAQAVSLSFPDGFKVSYSGDCRPSATFAEIGKDSTVLIHEATLEDDMAGDARAKKHCTTSEAIGVGIAMRARRVILTHFSQRYQKVPKMDEVRVETIKFEEATAEDEGAPLDANEAAATSIAGQPDERVDDVQMTDDSAQSEAVQVQRPAGGLSPVTQVSKEQLHTSMHHSNPAVSPSQDKLASNDPLEPVDTKKPPSRTFAARPSEKFHDVQPPADMKVVVAFDYMSVKVGDITYLQNLMPSIVNLFETLEFRKTEAKDLAAKAHDAKNGAKRGNKSDSDDAGGHGAGKGGNAKNKSKRLAKKEEKKQAQKDEGETGKSEWAQRHARKNAGSKIEREVQGVLEQSVVEGDISKPKILNSRGVPPASASRANAINPRALTEEVPEKEFEKSTKATATSNADCEPLARPIVTPSSQRAMELELQALKKELQALIQNRPPQPQKRKRKQDTTFETNPEVVESVLASSNPTVNIDPEEMKLQALKEKPPPQPQKSKKTKKDSNTKKTKRSHKTMFEADFRETEGPVPAPPVRPITSRFPSEREQNFFSSNVMVEEDSQAAAEAVNSQSPQALPRDPMELKLQALKAKSSPQQWRELMRENDIPVTETMPSPVSALSPNPIEDLERMMVEDVALEAHATADDGSAQSPKTISLMELKLLALQAKLPPGQWRGLMKKNNVPDYETMPSPALARSRPSVEVAAENIDLAAHNIRKIADPVVREWEAERLAYFIMQQKGLKFHQRYEDVREGILESMFPTSQSSSSSLWSTLDMEEEEEEEEQAQRKGLQDPAAMLMNLATSNMQRRSLVPHILAQTEIERKVVGGKTRPREVLNPTRSATAARVNAFVNEVDRVKLRYIVPAIREREIVAADKRTRLGEVVVDSIVREIKTTPRYEVKLKEARFTRVRRSKEVGEELQAAVVRYVSAGGEDDDRSGTEWEIVGGKTRGPKEAGWEPMREREVVGGRTRPRRVMEINEFQKVRLQEARERATERRVVGGERRPREILGLDKPPEQVGVH